MINTQHTISNLMHNPLPLSPIQQNINQYNTINTIDNTINNSTKIKSSSIPPTAKTSPKNTPNKKSVLNMKDSLQNSKQFIINLEKSNVVETVQGKSQRQMLVQGKSQRQILVEKRKSYAKSIRQKNKVNLKTQQKTKTKNTPSNINETFNNSLNLSPHKLTQIEYELSFIQNQKQTLQIKELQQYDHINSAVFRQTSINKLNQNTFKSNTLQSNQKLKQNNLLRHIDDFDFKGAYLQLSDCLTNSNNFNPNSNRQGYSARKHLNNKENRTELPNPVSNKKRGSKANSYAQLFDKKNTMSTQKNITNQKDRNENNLSISKQMSSIKRQAISLKAMVSSQSALSQEFRCELTQLMNFQGNLSLTRQDKLRSEVEAGRCNGSGLNVEESFSNGLVLNQKDGEKCSQKVFGFDGMVQQIPTAKCSLSQCQISGSSERQSDKNQIYQSNQIKKKKQQKLLTQLSSKLSIQSNLVCQSIHHSDYFEKVRNQEDKEITLLTKQNSTFKRQLATFRKQNSTLKKQLQQAKTYIKQMQEKAKSLIEEQKALSQREKVKIQTKDWLKSQDNIIYLQAQLKQNQTNLQPALKLIENKERRVSNREVTENSLQQIISLNEEELFSLKSNNKALQLKVYMLEKKIAHEGEVGRKRLALEISSWRDKYNKLRNQHLRFKNSSFTHSDSSFSMDISSEE